MIDITRRRFLILAASASAVGLVVPAFTPPRRPYVKAGTSVSYIGLAMYPEPVFTGSTIVREVHEWDGVGYPVTLADQGYSTPPRLMASRFYDSDLSDMLVDVPRYFWHHKANWDRYPNVHAYIREKRYGEDPLKYWESRHTSIATQSIGTESAA